MPWTISINGRLNSPLSNPELEPPGARTAARPTSAGADAAEKEELRLCGGRVFARGSIPGR